VSAVYRRCGCRAEGKDGKPGKQLGAACPQLKSDPRHGSWGYYLSDGSDPKTKKRRQYREGGFGTKREAVSALAELKTKLDKGIYTAPTKITLGEYAEQWLQRRETTGKGLRVTTVAPYRRYIDNDIVPSKLGRMMLTDIRRHHINQFTADLINAGRGAVTIRRILARLHTIFQTAVRDGIVPANAASDTDKPALGDSPVRVWEPDDVRTFLQRAAQHRLGPLFEIAVLSGLRRGELTALRWSDVDLAKRKVSVRHSRVTIDGRISEQQTTKTKAGLRTVPLSDVAVASLLAWQLRQGEEAAAAQDAWQGDGHVFTDELGRPLDPNYVTRLFQKIRKQDVPLPELTFHGLRHCAASLMLASGADIAVVSKLMGHASISVTSDVYGHLVGTIAQKAVDGAANLIAHTVHTHQGVNG
jgi:integrase